MHCSQIKDHQHHKMTAAKEMEIKARLPGCAGQAAGAVSAKTQVKMEEAHKLLKSPKSQCPDIWIRLPRHKSPKSWSSMEDPVVPLERNLYGHSLAGLLWERQFEKILLKYGWEKVPNWECSFVHREKGLFLSVYVDVIKFAGKKQNTDPMWKVLNAQVDLGQSTSFFDHVYLGCTPCEEYTLTRHIFSYLHTCFTVSHVTLAQGVVRVMSSIFHLVVRCDLSSTLHFAPSQSLSSTSLF